MNVLSLFDGISCGMVALERVGIKVDNYDAYEIEKNAIKISEKNYPNINHLGDVFQGDFSCSPVTHEKYDILIGGSPCTYWSIAQKADSRETVSEGFGWELFSQYLRALNEAKPKYFIYENNKSMSPVIKAEITKHLGVEPIYINSSLVSAQSRKRLYWTNIPNVGLPEDRGILLSDILESGRVDRDKSLCIARRYAGCSGSQSYLCRRYWGKSFYQLVFEGDIDVLKSIWKNNPRFECAPSYKNARRLTVVECERLQTLPDNYTAVEGLSDVPRIEAIGNGWTVDVIAHIMSYIPKD